MKSTSRSAYFEGALRALPDRAPLAFVDVDAFERNVRQLASLVGKHGKTLRVATKSVRSPELLRRILALGGDTIRGLMVFSAREAEALAAQGFDDFLLAYPTLQRDDIEALVRLLQAQKIVRVAIDDVAQLAPLHAVASEHDCVIPVVLDVDMSFRVGGLHIGVRRSPLHDVDEVIALADRIASFSALRIDGLLAYEAQIAGLTDNSPFANQAVNLAKRAFKQLSRLDVSMRRQALVTALTKKLSRPLLVNGAGSSNLTWALDEVALTEVTAGSGFLASHLFDYYHQTQFAAAAFFVLQVTRRPAPGFVTCQGGGYVASGEVGVDRLPVPVWPEGLQLLPLEGVGEVQTPLRVPDDMHLPLGSRVVFRHAKAGELGEHFNHYVLVREGVVEGEAKTYRGLGWVF